MRKSLLALVVFIAVSPVLKAQWDPNCRCYVTDSELPTGGGIIDFGTYMGYFNVVDEIVNTDSCKATYSYPPYGDPYLIDCSGSCQVQLIIKLIYGNDTTGVFEGECAMFVGLPPSSEGNQKRAYGLVDDVNQALIYPNPVREGKDIVFMMPGNEAFQLELTDYSGRIVYQANDIVGKALLNTANFSKGIYTARISDGAHTTIKKVVIH